MKPLLIKLCCLALASSCLAQFPSTPTGLTVVESKADPNVSISYKETNICETTPGVKSYSGFVNLPASSLAGIADYDISTYFIYFQARNNASTAPLAIYLAGGPGESSIYAALSSESGPCYANLNGTNTIINPWSFNENVNMLYIDQPVDSGFSYVELAPAIADLATGHDTSINSSSPLPATNATFGYGTFPSQDPTTITNTTVMSARALWKFAETWLSSFSEYSTSSNKISVWGNSYGGFWVPETAAQFHKQLKNLSCDHPLQNKNLTVDTIGITNGCIDLYYSMQGYLDYAYNNTYGVRLISEDVYNEASNNVTKPGGCLDLITQCRQLGNKGDPNFIGNNDTVNNACDLALGYCFVDIIQSFDFLQNRSAFDIAQAPSACPYYLPVSQYLNTASVQADLGVPLNFTYASDIATAVFGFPSPFYNITGTGDICRQAGLPNLEYLLENGVKLAMIYGDRDYRCPWTGAEATALAVAWQGQTGFQQAGYEEIQGISSGDRGVVKQYGQLSFSRVFNAGHSVSAYAPEAVQKIFDRAMFGMDVGTGTQDVAAAGDQYHTTGPTTSWGWRNTLPDDLKQTCMVEGQWTDVDPFAVALGMQ